MKLTEFRVGNNVFHASHPDTVFEIKSIDRHDNEIGLLDDGYFVKLDTAGLKPITLTDKLLEKIGMKKRFDSATCNIWDMKDANIRNGNLCLVLIKDGWIYPTAPGAVPFYNLHQLQNLYYALTGEELTINL